MTHSLGDVVIQSRDLSSPDGGAACNCPAPVPAVETDTLRLAAIVARTLVGGSIVCSADIRNDPHYDGASPLASYLGVPVVSFGGGLFFTHESRIASAWKPRC